MVEVDAWPAEVVEIVGRTGMTGEATQVKVRVNDAKNPRDIGRPNGLLLPRLQKLYQVEVHLRSLVGRSIHVVLH